MIACQAAFERSYPVTEGRLEEMEKLLRNADVMPAADRPRRHCYGTGLTCDRFCRTARNSTRAPLRVITMVTVSPAR